MAVGAGCSGTRTGASCGIVDLGHLGPTGVGYYSNTADPRCWPWSIALSTFMRAMPNLPGEELRESLEQFVDLAADTFGERAGEAPIFLIGSSGPSGMAVFLKQELF